MSDEIPASADEYYLTDFDDSDYIDAITGELKPGFRYPIIAGDIPPLRGGTIRDPPRLIDPWYLLEAYSTRLGISRPRIGSDSPISLVGSAVTGKIEFGPYAQIYDLAATKWGNESNRNGTTQSWAVPGTYPVESTLFDTSLPDWGVSVDSYNPVLQAEQGKDTEYYARKFAARMITHNTTLYHYRNSESSPPPTIFPITKDLILPIYAYLSSLNTLVASATRGCDKSGGGYYEEPRIRLGVAVAETGTHEFYDAVNSEWKEDTGWGGAIYDYEWGNQGLLSGSRCNLSDIGVTVTFNLGDLLSEIDSSHEFPWTDESQTRLYKAYENSKVSVFLVWNLTTQLKSGSGAYSTVYDSYFLVPIVENMDFPILVPYIEQGQKKWKIEDTIQKSNVSSLLPPTISTKIEEYWEQIRDENTKQSGTIILASSNVFVLKLDITHTKCTYVGNQWNYAPMRSTALRAGATPYSDWPKAALTSIKAWGSVSDVLEVPMIYHGYVTLQLGELQDSSSSSSSDEGNASEEVYEERADENFDVATVILPATLEQLGANAFASTPGISTIVFKGALPTISPTAFDDVMPSNITVQVLPERSKTWQTAIEENMLTDTEGNKIEFSLIELYSPTYTIVFYAGDHGSFRGAETYVSYVKEGDPIIAPTVTEDEGYDFIEWDPEIPTTATGNMTFTAQYKVQTCVWTFYAGEHGSFAGGATQVVLDFQYGYAPQPEDLPQVIPSGTDYTFNGWNVPSIVTGDMTFTATYTDTRFTWVTEVIEGTEYWRVIGVQNIPDTVTTLVIPSAIVDNGVTKTITEVKLDSASRTLINNSNIVAVEIQSGIQRLGANSFSGCSRISSVVIPDSTIEILRDAFSGISSSAVVSTSVKNSYDREVAIVKSIDGWIVSAQIKQAALQTGFVEISRDMNSRPYRGIGYSAFSGIGVYEEYLNDIDMSQSEIVGISASAFASSESGLRRVTLPSSTLRFIGESAFGNTKLETVSFGSALTHIASYAFANTEIYDIAIPESVRFLGNGVFSKTTYLRSTTVSMPTRFPLWAIDEGRAAFSGSVEYIASAEGYGVPPQACQNYTGVTSVTIGSNITVIGANAFAGCTGLQTVSIGDDVVDIMNNAFGNCSSLYSVSIGSGLTNVDPVNFTGCQGLKEFVVSQNNPALAALVNGTLLVAQDNNTVVMGAVPASGSVDIPASIEAIGARAFFGSTRLTSISFNSGVILSSIGDYAFSGCEGLSSLNLPSFSNGNVGIGAYAFQGCSGLGAVTFGATVPEYLGDYAFKNCTSLQNRTSGQSPVIDFMQNRSNIRFSSYVFEGSLVGKILALPRNSSVAIPAQGNVSSAADDSKKYTIWVPRDQQSSYPSQNWPHVVIGVYDFHP